jgi:hypothetical protein
MPSGTEFQFNVPFDVLPLATGMWSLVCRALLWNVAE